MGLKRHESLIQCSREHHLFLVHARDLKWVAQGKGDLKTTVDLWLKFFDQCGRKHFQIEESALFPYCVSSLAWVDEKSIDVAYHQHDKIKDLYQKMTIKHHDDAVLMKNCLALSELIDMNVRHEERVIFELIQESLSAKELNNLSELLSIYQT